MSKKLPRSPYLNPNFSAAIEEFAIALKKTSPINHRTSKGVAREDVLRTFFKQRLPTKFAVTTGEVVDLRGQTGPQLDIMIYDQTVNFALNAEDIQVLPAETLLASIEVKSKLNKQEIKSSIEAAKKLKALKPFDIDLVRKNTGKPKQCRYYHCLFAYESDMSEDNWVEKEINRFNEQGADNSLFDSLYVLNRGIINFPNKIWRAEDQDGGAIINFYFSILNFIQRESGRRPPAPIERYVVHKKSSWIRLR